MEKYNKIKATNQQNFGYGTYVLINADFKLNAFIQNLILEVEGVSNLDNYKHNPYTIKILVGECFFVSDVINEIRKNIQEFTIYKNIIVTHD